MTYKIDAFTLFSGIDIPVPELGVSVHQPALKEIAYIGEKTFYQSVQALLIDKEQILKNIPDDNIEDKKAISEMSNFQVIMTTASQNAVVKVNMITLLTLLFPEYIIQAEDRFIIITHSKMERFVTIDESNFTILQDVIRAIFCLNSSSQNEEEFNPQGERARQIAEKIKKGRDKVAAQKGESAEEETSGFLPKYISSLGIGTNSLNISDLLNLTLYQLFDQLERYGLYSSYNMLIQAKMAGAKDVEDIDWLKNIDKN